MKTTEFKRKVRKSALQAEGRRFEPVNSHAGILIVMIGIFFWFK